MNPNPRNIKVDPEADLIFEEKEEILINIPMDDNKKMALGIDLDLYYPAMIDYNDGWDEYDECKVVEFSAKELRIIDNHWSEHDEPMAIINSSNQRVVSKVNSDDDSCDNYQFVIESKSKKARRQASFIIKQEQRKLRRSLVREQRQSLNMISIRIYRARLISTK